MSTTPVTTSKKRKSSNISPPKSIDFARSELEGFISGRFAFLDEKSSETLVILIHKLSIGDPVLVLHWNDSAIAAAAALNPANTQAFLVGVITQHGGRDVTGTENIFTFTSDIALTACTAALPMWSRSLGPVFSAIQGQMYVPPIAEAQVIRATNKVQPDIVVYPFFRTD
jgi:hypothetical protein